MNEDIRGDRSPQEHGSPSAAGSDGTVNLPPTAQLGDTLNEPSRQPDAAGGSGASAEALRESLDEPPMPGAGDLLGATTDGDPGAKAGSASFLSGGATLEYEDQGLRTPLPPVDAVKGVPRSFSWLGQKGGKSGEVSVPATVAGSEALGVLGRGAMGVVYKARQRGLHRVVALKMILSGEHAGEREVARFQTEAEAVARLQHPNIVQIYEVGEEAGKPYFSLELVDGGSLSRKLNGEPQPPMQAARLLYQLACAMHAAHEKNIIHRDLKPANILLTADGTPKISDFGLAKRLEEDAGQTHSGAILGTPTYMSPEQADGNTQAIGPLSDVYSLGVILYEALTGRVPFRSPTILETLLQVKTREPIAPTLLQPKVPRDLETICLKCLQKDPKKRYASAADLAEDLRRFLNKEPILARPVGRIERGWRWCQRNPLGAAILLLILVWAASMSGLVVVLSVQKQRTEEARRVAVNNEADAIQARDAAEKARQFAEQQEKKAIEQRDRADREGTVAKQSYDNALKINLQMIEEMLKGLQSRNLVLHASAEVRALRQEIQNRFADKMTVMARELERSGATSFAVATAHQRLGDMLQRMGRNEEAMQRFQKGAELTRRLAAEMPNSDLAQGNLSVMVKRLGDMELKLRSDAEPARRHYRESLRISQELFDHPRSRELTAAERTMLLSHHELSLGRVELDLGHPSAAGKHLARFLELRQKWWSDAPEGASQNSYLAEAWMWQGIVAWHEDHEDNAREAFAKALQIYAKLIAKYPQDYSFKEDLAEILGHQGDAWLHLGKLAEAKKSYAESRKTLEVALARQPDKVALRILLAQTEERQAALATLEGQRKEADKHYQAALSLRRELLQLDPNQLALQNAIVLLQAHCGQQDRAAANVAVLLQRNPNSPLLLLNAARCYASCAAATTAEARKTYLAKALDSVRGLLATGYADRMVLRTDPDLALLRQEPAYRELLAALTKH